MPALPLEEELHRLLERIESKPSGRLFAPLADCYRRLGRLDEAYKVCVDGLARHPRYSTGFVILGKIHLDRDESAEARTAFETVLSIDPENLVALRELAIDAGRRGDQDVSHARWEQVIALDPDSTDAEQALAELRGESTETSVDEPEIEAARDEQPSKEPSEGDAVLDAGSRVEDMPENEAVLEKATDAEAAAPEVLTAMSREDSLHSGEGMSFTDGGDEAETIITVTLADIYYEQGFKAKALEMYRTVLVRHPEAAKVAGLREKVDQIEEEMDSLARRFQQTSGEAAEVGLEELEGSADPEDDSASEGDGDDGVRKFRSWVQKRRGRGS